MTKEDSCSEYIVKQSFVESLIEGLSYKGLKKKNGLEGMKETTRL